MVSKRGLSEEKIKGARAKYKLGRNR